MGRWLSLATALCTPLVIQPAVMKTTELSDCLGHLRMFLNAALLVTCDALRFDDADSGWDESELSDFQDAAQWLQQRISGGNSA